MTGDPGGGAGTEPGLGTDSLPPVAPDRAAGARSMDMGRGARRVSGFTMLSRLLGLVRGQIFAGTPGAGA